MNNHRTARLSWVSVLAFAVGSGSAVADPEAAITRDYSLRSTALWSGLGTSSTTTGGTVDDAAPAEEWEKDAPVSISVDYAVVSDYIWRGINFSDYPARARNA